MFQSAELHRWLRKGATPERLLRASLGIVYLWFGALKLIGLSPVLELVRRAYPPMGTVPLYVGLALFEVGLGAALLSGIWRRGTAAAAILHLVGTFGVLIASPRTVFLPRFPFLTLEGEFVVKNLVLLAAAIALLLYGDRELSLPDTAGHARALAVSGFLVLAAVLGFAAARLHHAVRVAAQTPVARHTSSLQISAATLSFLIGTGAEQPIEMRGVLIDRCPLLGCWLKLRDASGEVFVDLAPAGLNARGIAIGSRIRVTGRIGKTREGQVGFVASTMQ